MDYLLKDENSEPASVPKSKAVTLNLANINFERVSKKKIHGLPLWHIGRSAKGIIAIGLSAKGVISIGLFSVGILSFGLFTVGLLAFGVLAIGLLSGGAFSCGVIACGAISVGIVSVGATAVGYFSVGALAIGKYFAIGNHAIAQIALGGTKAIGTVYQKIGELTAQDIADVKELLDVNVPPYLSWAKELIKLFVLFI